MAKANKEEIKVNKSAWIREQPAALTAKELVERAAKQNIVITQAQVYTTRHGAKKAEGGGSGAAGEPANGKSKSKPGRKPKVVAAVAALPAAAKINKSAWIREQSDSLSAKEVVEKAKREKIEITQAQVYTARSSAKTTKAVGSPTTLPTPVVVKGKPGRKPKTATVAHGATVRQDAIKAIMRLGTDETRRLLDQVESGQVLM